MVVIGILAVPGVARAGQPSVSGLQIEADRLELASRHQELRLKGNVRVRTHGPRGEVAIRASLVVVRLDSEGTPVALDARGPLTVRLGSSRATARRLQMRIPRNGAPRVVELLGDVRLVLVLSTSSRPRSPGLTVAGERIWLELESGRMSVDRARVELGGAGRQAPSADRRAGGEGHGG